MFPQQLEICRCLKSTKFFFLCQAKVSGSKREKIEMKIKHQNTADDAAGQASLWASNFGRAAYSLFNFIVMNSIFF